MLGKNVCDLCQIDKVAVQNLLSGSILNTTREPSPGSSSKDSVSNSLPFGSKTNYLLEHSLTFFVDGATSLKHNRNKIVVRLLKCGSVPIDFLVFRIRFTWFESVEVRDSERADDGDVNGKATAEAPVLNGDVTRTAT